MGLRRVKLTEKRKQYWTELFVFRLAISNSLESISLDASAVIVYDQLVLTHVIYNSSTAKENHFKPHQSARCFEWNMRGVS